VRVQGSGSGVRVQGLGPRAQVSGAEPETADAGSRVLNRPPSMVQVSLVMLHGPGARVSESVFRVDGQCQKLSEASLFAKFAWFAHIFSSFASPVPGRARLRTGAPQSSSKSDQELTFVFSQPSLIEGLLSGCACLLIDPPSGCVNQRYIDLRTKRLGMQPRVGWPEGRT